MAVTLATCLLKTVFANCLYLQAASNLNHAELNKALATGQQPVTIASLDLLTIVLSCT